MHLVYGVGRINICIRRLESVLLNYQHKNSSGDTETS